MRIRNFLIGLGITATLSGCNPKFSPDVKLVTSSRLETKIEAAMPDSAFHFEENTSELIKRYHDLLTYNKYTVLKGESIDDVAEHYGVSTNRILAINSNLENDAVLYEGQVLNVPNIEPIYDKFYDLMKYKHIIDEVASETGIEPRLLYAIVRKESNGNTHARSSMGALGLGQIMPSTGSMFGVKNPGSLFNPKINLRVTARYLAYLMDKFGYNIEHVLASYNAGEGKVERILARGSDNWEKYLPKETRQFVPTVLAYYN